MKKIIVLLWCLLLSWLAFANYVSVWKTIGIASLSNSWQIISWGVSYTNMNFSQTNFFSKNGRFVVFSSDSSQVVSWDTNGTWDVFLRDLDLGTTELISVSTTWAQGNRLSNTPMVSDDWRYVVFASESTNLVAWDTNNNRDIFMRDRLLGTTIRVNLSSAWAQWTQWTATQWYVTPDGRLVVFTTPQNSLIAWDTNSRLSWSDLFIRNLMSSTTTLWNINRTGIQSLWNNNDAVITPDGRFVLWSSRADNLVPWDTNGSTDVFLRDTLSWTTEIVSVNSSWQIVAGGGTPTSLLAQITPDWRYVIFRHLSSELVSWDTNGVEDIFVRDRVLWTTEMISLRDSSEQLTASASAPQISDDWRYVFFNTTDQNVLWWVSIWTGGVYMRDRLLGTTELVTRTDMFWFVNGWVSWLRFSSDLTRIAYIASTWATNLLSSVVDDNAGYDIYVAERRLLHLPAPTVIAPSSWDTLNINNVIFAGTWNSGYMVSLYATGITQPIRTWLVDELGQWETTPLQYTWWFETIIATQTYLTWRLVSSWSVVHVDYDMPSPVISGYSYATWWVVFSWLWFPWAIISVDIVWNISTGMASLIDGSWSLSLISWDGVYSWFVTQNIWNITSTWVTISFTIDTTPPADPLITYPLHQGTGVVLSWYFTGQWESGAIVYVLTNWVLYTWVISSGASWIVGPILWLSNDTEYTVQAYQKDAFWNQSDSVFHTYRTIWNAGGSSSWWSAPSGGWWWGWWWGGGDAPSIAPPPLPNVPPSAFPSINPGTTNQTWWSTWSIGGGVNGSGFFLAWFEWDDEMLSAVEFAYAYDLDRNNSETRASIYSSLTREELARIMVQYVKNADARGLTKRVSCNLRSYRDFRTISRWYASSVVEACQYWLMWIKTNQTQMELFNPRWFVTRAELSAVLSRFIYGNKYDIDDTNEWYRPHVNALAQGWIIKKLDNPMKIELRWFLFIMLQRLYEGK